MIASHIIFGAYGFWLPNDPRGSWSNYVGAWNLFRYGPATKTNETRSVAYQPHDHSLRISAKKALKRNPVKFTGIQARAIGRGFAAFSGKAGFSINACAILPDHVHLVVAVNRLNPKSLANHLKGHATSQLMQERIHPFGHQLDSNGRPEKCFARGEWTVFLDTVDEVNRAIEYVEQNPIKEGLPKQNWWFVKSFQP